MKKYDFKVNSSILEVLSCLQKQGESYIVGGFIRDTLLGIEPNDVDIATVVPLDKIKELYPNLQGSEKGMEFGVARFKKKHTEFEVSYYENNLLESMCERDLTVDAFYFNGKELIDLFNGMEDLNNKILRSPSDPFLMYKENPLYSLRTIRLSSTLGFHIEPTLLEAIKINNQFLELVNESRVQQEGYKIIRSAYPFHALHYLHEIGLLKHSIDFDKHISFPEIKDKPFMTLLLMGEYISLDALYEFIDLFYLSKQLKEKIYYLYPYVKEDIIPEKPFVLNEVIQLKRFQYQNEPKKLQEFLKKVRNQKK